MSLSIGQKIACKHGHSSSPEYRALMNAKARCHNPNHPRFPEWGAVGITVCDEWRNSFETFFADMGKRPSPSHSLDRINGMLGYSKENCRWATKKEQSVNRPTWTNVITFNGRSQTITDWAIELGISRRSLYERLERWSLEKALTTPKVRK